MIDYHGTLWFVHKDMIVDTDKNNCINGRKILIERGEIIEFRYHHEMNFRTMDDKYYCVTEEAWLKHCTKIGIIWDKIRSKNVASTEEIWRLRLFDVVKSGMNLYDKFSEANREES